MPTMRQAVRHTHWRFQAAQYTEGGHARRECRGQRIRLYNSHRERLPLQAGHTPSNGRQHHRTLHEEQRRQLRHRDQRPEHRHQPLYNNRQP